jgi:hypothetical protein
MRQVLSISVLQIFSDRLHVAHCRSGCLAGWKATGVRGEKAIMSGQEQCWDVCGMLGSDTPTWAEVCNREVCVGPCQIACKMFFSTRTTIGQSKRNLFNEAPRIETCSVVWEIAPPAISQGLVFMVVGREGDGRWSEVDQTMGNSLKLTKRFVEVFVVALGGAGVEDIRKVHVVHASAECENVNKESDNEDPWTILLDKIVPDGSIYQVHMHWEEKNASKQSVKSENLPFRPQAKYAIRWEIDSVVGVILTNQSVAMIPLPPQSSITAEVSLLDSTLVSSSITVSTPALPTMDTLNTASVTTLSVSIIALLALSLLLILVMNLYRRTKDIPNKLDNESSLGSGQSMSTSSTTIETCGQNKSLVTFETFLEKYKISNLNFEPKRKSISVELYVI